VIGPYCNVYSCDIYNQVAPVYDGLIPYSSSSEMQIERGHIMRLGGVLFVSALVSNILSNYSQMRSLFNAIYMSCHQGAAVQTAKLNEDNTIDA